VGVDRRLIWLVAGLCTLPQSRRRVNTQGCHGPKPGLACDVFLCRTPDTTVTTVGLHSNPPTGRTRKNTARNTVNFLFWIVGTTVIRSCIGASDGLGPACRKKPQAHSGDLAAGR
jgi:hypothetical protein